MSQRCKERGCEREHGHRGLHMSRTWNTQSGSEIIDEWGEAHPHRQAVEAVMTIRIFVNDRERLAPPAFRGSYLLAIEGVSPVRRIFEDRDGLLQREYHPTEWIVPNDGDRFQIVPFASGPGGSWPRRIRAIQTAIEHEAGNAEAWTLFDESERNRDD